MIDESSIRVRFEAFEPILDERGLAELRSGEAVDAKRIRKPVAGRKPTSQIDTRLMDDLRALLEPTTRGDPPSPLMWTCKSLSQLARWLREMGHESGRTSSQTRIQPAIQPQDAGGIEQS